MFFSKVLCHFLIICCEKVSSVDEALPQPCSQAGGSATLRWALIEPADLTFVSLTLRGASAPCLDHNTISTWEPLTSAAQWSHRAERLYRRPESLFAFQLQLHESFLPSHRQNYPARNRRKSVFCSWQYGLSKGDILKQICIGVVLSGNVFRASNQNGSLLCFLWK